MAYRRTERVQEKLEDKRNRILQAVRAVVGEVGFLGAQVATVAEAAGVATGTVYRHFPSKGELFAEALALNAGHELGVMAAVAASEGSVSIRLADAVRVFALRAVRARLPQAALTYLADARHTPWGDRPAAWVAWTRTTPRARPTTSSTCWPKAPLR